MPKARSVTLTAVYADGHKTEVEMEGDRFVIPAPPFGEGEFTIGRLPGRPLSLAELSATMESFADMAAAEEKAHRDKERDLIAAWLDEEASRAMRASFEKKSHDCGIVGVALSTRALAVRENAHRGKPGA
ncbi:MAG: hypothetical protein WC985_10135 [Thermoplasmata archaeon]